jgi:hypothetical protein
MRRIIATAGIALALIVGLHAAPADAKAAPRWYCSTTTTVGEACIPDPTTTVKPTTTTHYATTTAATTTTAASTTIATTTTAATTTTTVPQTTTTAFNCGLCAGQFSSTTTVPATTTTVAVTTIPDTTAVDQTVPPALIPPTVVEAPTTTVMQELPHTGVQSLWLLAVGFGLLFLGWACYALRAALK